MSENNDTIKQCTGCKQWLPMTEEYFGKPRIHYRNYGQEQYIYFRERCKECRRKQKNESQKRNRKSANIRNRRYAETKGNQQRREQYATDAEYRQRMIDRSIEFQRDNPDYVNKKNKIWREANPERVKEIYKTTYLNARQRNPEKMRSIGRNRRARLQQASGSHTAQDILDLYNEQEGRCAYCGITLHDDYHVDHIQPLARGGSNDKDNLCCACPDCNLSKADKTIDEWTAMRGW